MRYSKKVPKMEGWYWVRSNNKPDIIKNVWRQQDHKNKCLMVEHVGGGGHEYLQLQHWLEDNHKHDLQFAGPIFQPKDMVR